MAASQLLEEIKGIKGIMDGLDRKGEIEIPELYTDNRSAILVAKHYGKITKWHTHRHLQPPSCRCPKAVIGRTCRL